MYEKEKESRETKVEYIGNKKKKVNEDKMEMENKNVERNDQTMLLNTVEI